MRLPLLGLPTLLRVPAAALDIAAKTLRVLADVNDQIATSLVATEAREEQARADAPAPTVPTPPATHIATAQAAVSTPTAAAVSVAPLTDTTEQPADTADLGTPDLAALAALPAPRVIAALESMSTEDLAELHTYESSHRRRATVLRAIEAAAAPPVQAGDDIDLDDVRQPDELVYTTSTPSR